MFRLAIIAAKRNTMRICLNSQVEIWQTVNEEKLREDLQQLLGKGIRSLAVVLLHSYMYVSH